jgi:hypothetical protein
MPVVLHDFASGRHRPQRHCRLPDLFDGPASRCDAAANSSKGSSRKALSAHRASRLAKPRLSFIASASANCDLASTR